MEIQALSSRDKADLSSANAGQLSSTLGERVRISRLNEGGREKMLSSANLRILSSCRYVVRLVGMTWKPGKYIGCHCDTDLLSSGIPVSEHFPD